MTETFDRQREWVNEQFGNMTRGRSLSLKQKSRILKKLWKQAKRRID
tara:strand:+ start:182 stop:322 length:141 start_codon:yes stop_codon:yes gene_type:complete